MRNHFAHISAALAIAATAVACNGRTDQVGNDRETQSGRNRATYSRVSMRGCVQARNANELTLQQVVLAPPAEQPNQQETMQDPIIKQGSWVRLAAGEDLTEQLRGYMGKEVSVVGEITDPGLNTIGTAGQDGTAQTQMPATSSVANGDAPQVAVERVEKIADTCAGQQ
jgi:hypothetical protein